MGKLTCTMNAISSRAAAPYIRLTEHDDHVLQEASKFANFKGARTLSFPLAKTGGDPLKLMAMRTLHLSGEGFELDRAPQELLIDRVRMDLVVKGDSRRALAWELLYRCPMKPSQPRPRANWAEGVVTQYVDELSPFVVEFSTCATEVDTARLLVAIAKLADVRKLTTFAGSIPRLSQVLGKPDFNLLEPRLRARLEQAGASFDDPMTVVASTTGSFVGF